MFWEKSVADGCHLISGKIAGCLSGAFDKNVAQSSFALKEKVPSILKGIYLPITGLGLMAIPGVGSVVAAGWLVATLSGAAAGLLAAASSARSSRPAVSHARMPRFTRRVCVAARALDGFGRWARALKTDVHAFHHACQESVYRSDFVDKFLRNLI